MKKLHSVLENYHYFYFAFIPQQLWIFSKEILSWKISTVRMEIGFRVYIHNIYLLLKMYNDYTIYKNKFDIRLY